MLLLLLLLFCSWKMWASDRFVFYWGEFLQHPDAQLDPQYTAIASMYEAATKPKAKKTAKP